MAANHFRLTFRQLRNSLNLFRHTLADVCVFLSDWVIRLVNAYLTVNRCKHRHAYVPRQKVLQIADLFTQLLQQLCMLLITNHSHCSPPLRAASWQLLHPR